MAVSNVGLGWAAGERNYNTLAQWFAAKKATGTFEEAVCSGDLGSSSVLIVTGDFSAGALVRGVVQYDGTNHDSLARLNARLAGQATSGLVVVQDLYIQTTGLNASISFTLNNVIQRCYLTSTGDTGSNSSILATATGGTAKNCVVHQPTIANIRGIRPTSNGRIENCVSIGSQYPIYSEWTDSKTINSFAVATASTTACQNYPNGVPALNANNASTDGTPATGTTTIRNVDKYAVFNDFDAGDFRIKMSSALGAAGIGAFFVNDAPGATYEGGAAMSFDVAAVGGGSITMSGGAGASLAVDSTGGGLVARAGGSVMSFGVDSTGGGLVARAGGSAFAFGVDAVGGGSITMPGGAVATFTISATGGGDIIPAAPSYTGGAALSFAVNASGGGVVLRTGGAALSFAVNASGGGLVARAGGAAASLSVDSSGGGQTIRPGGAVASFTVTAIGGGVVYGPGYTTPIDAPTIKIARSATANPAKLARALSAPVKLHRSMVAQTCKI